MSKVFCGQCERKFNSQKAELEHTCKVTGVKPTDIRSMGTNWKTIAQTALERGKEEADPEKFDKSLKELEE